MPALITVEGFVDGADRFLPVGPVGAPYVDRGRGKRLSVTMQEEAVLQVVRREETQHVAFDQTRNEDL